MRLNRGMDKENVAHLHNGVLHSRKNNDNLKFAGKWMGLENIILSEATQTQKEKYNMSSIIRHKAKQNQPTIHNPREHRQQKGP